MNHTAIHFCPFLSVKNEPAIYNIAIAIEKNKIWL